MSALDHPSPPGLRLVFIATGDIALPAFRHLLARGPRPLALVTQPDKPIGRHQTLHPPTIKTEALAAGIPVLQPAKIGDAASELAIYQPDILLVMAYGQLLRDNILTLPSIAAINLHASLLPRHRGAACIQAAIDADDPITGITSMHMTRQLDAGDVILSKSTAITPADTGGTLHDRLADLATEVLAESLARLANHTAPRLPQEPALATYAPKLGRDDGRLDWSQSAATLERRIRAYHPWPGTFTIATEAGKPKRLKIYPPVRVVDHPLSPGQLACQHDQLIVGCGHLALELVSLQPEGAKRMSARDYLHGRKPTEFQ